MLIVCYSRSAIKWHMPWCGFQHVATRASSASLVVSGTCAFSQHEQAGVLSFSTYLLTF